MGSSKKSAAATKTWEKLNESKWPKAKLARIVSLWTDGYSALDIARDLGDGYTRNAVVGKLYRMGLRRCGTDRKYKYSATLVPRKPRRAARDDRGSYAPKLPKSTKANTPHLNEVSSKRALVVVDVPLDERRTILSVTRHQCRWPYESGERMYFCNLDALPGKPYCECHAARARRKDERKDEPSEKSGFTAANSGLKRQPQPPGFRF